MVAKTEERLRKLRARIVKSGPGSEEYVAMRQGDPLSYGGARDLLTAACKGGGGASPRGGERDAERVVLLEYFVTEGEVLVFVGREDLEVPALHRIEVSRQRLSDWAFDIENTDVGDLRRWDLERWQSELGPLVGPLEERSEEGDLVWIVPHAELHLLPLHALKVGGRYLADRNPVVYSPSASVMRYCRIKGARGGEAALVLGIPCRPPATSATLGRRPRPSPDSSGPNPSSANGPPSGRSRTG